MVKGVSINFKSYSESVGKLLQLTKFENEIKKHSSIVLKPSLSPGKAITPAAFVESVLQYVLANKQPGAQVFIAEGSDGGDTMEMFEREGYKKLVESYPVSLVDLNTSETQEIVDGKFMAFSSIPYPKILLQSLVISMPKLAEDSEAEVLDSTLNMLGAYPSKHFSGWFTSKKNKLRKEPIKYAIHDILRCKFPQVALIDASSYGKIFIGNPIEVDKLASALVKQDGKVSHIRFLEDTLLRDLMEQAERQQLKAAKLAAAGAQNTI